MIGVLEHALINKEKEIDVIVLACADPVFGFPGGFIIMSRIVDLL